MDLLLMMTARDDGTRDDGTEINFIHPTVQSFLFQRRARTEISLRVIGDALMPVFIRLTSEKSLSTVQLVTEKVTRAGEDGSFSEILGHVEMNGPL